MSSSRAEGSLRSEIGKRVLGLLEQSLDGEAVNGKFSKDGQVTRSVGHENLVLLSQDGSVMITGSAL